MKIALHFCVARLAFAALAIAALCACNSSKPTPTVKEIATAEDEIYDAVIRHMTRPADRTVPITQLVFDDTLLTDLQPSGNVEACKQNTLTDYQLNLNPRPPLYNSLADKAYRFVTRSGDPDTLRVETIQNFLDRSCISGPLSQTFHTKLPKTFISAENAHIDWPIRKDGQKSFRQLYPGVGGMTAFSHVGFNSTLDQAIVSSRFVCGRYCGASYRHILQQQSGQWKVLSTWQVLMRNGDTFFAD